MSEVVVTYIVKALFSLYRTLTTEYPFIRHDPVVIAQVTCLVQYSPTEKPDCLRHGDDSNRDYETSA